MTTKRYSKANAINTLRHYAQSVATHGIFSRYVAEGYSGFEIDRGVADAAIELADRIAATPGKVLRKDFKDIVISSRDETITLPVNKFGFCIRNGSNQIVNKAKSAVGSAHAYGEFTFYTDIVFDIFSDLDW